jgi:predicted nuclease of predicted toxin-antitoxin system
MKDFLFDANVPSRLQFKPTLPFVSLSAVGQNPTDSEIWNYAATHRLVIVSKDTDFSDRIIIRTPPPWVVHLRFGSMRKRISSGACAPMATSRNADQDTQIGERVR